MNIREAIALVETGESATKVLSERIDAKWALKIAALAGLTAVPAAIVAGIVLLGNKNRKGLPPEPTTPPPPEKPAPKSSNTRMREEAAIERRARELLAKPEWRQSVKEKGIEDPVKFAYQVARYIVTRRR